MKKIIKNKRLIYFVLFLILLFVEVAIAKFLKGGLIRHYFGDVLIIPLLYCFIRSIFKNSTEKSALYLFAVGVIAEMMQYFDIIKVLGLENNKILSVMIGRTFDIKDIICYLIGAILILVFEKSFKNIKKNISK